VKIQGREFSPESEEREKLRTYEKKKVGSQKRRKKYRERERREEEILRICQQLCVVTKATKSQKVRQREREGAVSER